MAAHYLFVPDHHPGDDVDYVLQHPVECVKGYGVRGPDFECGVQYELDAAGFDGLFDKDNRLQPGHWLIDAQHYSIPSGPWGPEEWDMQWEVQELRRTVEKLEVVE